MKTVFSLLAFLSISTASMAQGFYFRAGLGYAMPMAGQTIDGTGAPYSGSRSFSTYARAFTVKSASFSAGMQGTFGFGYMFSKNIGVQLDVNASLLARSYSFEEKNVLVDYGSGGILSNITITQQADMPVMLAPALVLQTSGDKLNAYTHLGPCIPLMTQIIQDYHYVNVPGTGTPYPIDYSYTQKNSFSLGFSGGVGVQYKVNRRTSIWAEVSMLSLSVYAKRADMTSFSENNQPVSLANVISPAPTYYYTKSGTTDTNGTTLPTYSMPFSNIGLNVGVRISLGKPSKNSSNDRSSGTREMTPADENKGNRRPRSGSFR